MIHSHLPGICRPAGPVCFALRNANAKSWGARDPSGGVNDLTTKKAAAMRARAVVMRVLAVPRVSAAALCQAMDARAHHYRCTDPTLRLIEPVEPTPCS